MIIMGLDGSFAKSGITVSKCSEKGIKILYTELFKTNKDLEPIERITESINQIYNVYKKYKVDLIIKEAAIMGRSSTGLPVIKFHGALEYFCNDNTIPLEEIHNQTIKAFARKLVNDKTFDKKKVVAKGNEIYFNKEIEEQYTPRGRLLDDIADSIMITIIYFENNLK